MKLYTYIMVHDTGFAPNPYGGYCTVATCKPQIRRQAQVGDWVVGFGSAQRGLANRIIYAMQVSEILALEEYDTDSRFEVKKPQPRHRLPETARASIPNVESPDAWKKGDNIYYKGVDGEWKQRPSYHKPKDMEHDLSGRNVLIGKHFYYFGDEAVPMPAEYLALMPRGRGYRVNHDPHVVTAFLDWLDANFEPGVHGEPSSQPPHQRSSSKQLGV